MLKATGSEEKAVVGETKNEVDIGNRVEVSEEQSREEAKAKNRREALAALTADKGAVGSDREEQREREKVGRTNRRNTIMTMRGYYGKAGNVGGTNGASGMGRGMGMGMSMGMGMGMGVGGGRRPEDLSGEALELMTNRPADVIPNAIVVKNINFAVSRAEFLSIMTSLGLPLPYAFDYHYENGNFKGLAFGNFRSNEDTARVIVTMDGYKLLGRAIKVEYKKTLPMHDDDAQHNKESRERGAADLRGIGDMGIRKQHAMMDEGVMGRGRPPMGFGGDEEYQPGNLEFDENDLLRFVDFREKDPKLLYNVINHFRSDNSVSEMELPPALNHYQRQLTMLLAEHFKLNHETKGSGTQRSIRLYKNLETLLEAAEVRPTMSTMLSPQFSHLNINPPRQARGRPMSMMGNMAPPRNSNRNSLLSTSNLALLGQQSGLDFDDTAPLESLASGFMRSRSSTVSGTKGGFTPRNHSNIYNTTASGPHQPHQPSSPALYASSSTQKNINMASEDSPNASGDAPSQRQQQIRILQEKRNNRISAIFNAPPVPIHATTPDTPQVPIISIHKSDSKAIPIISPTSRSLVVPSDAENASNSD